MCGFVGLVSKTEVASEIHVALQALQHRGQDSAGIATMNPEGTRFTARRGLGTVPRALTDDDIEALRGPLGIGHVRYPTIGDGMLEDAQPFFYRQPGVLMAHNGGLTNYDALRDSLRERSIHLLSSCDVEPALCELSDALMRHKKKAHGIEDALVAIREMRAAIRGSYSIVAALRLDDEPTLVVVRDPHGIRPAVIGRRADGSYMAASESVALDALGFERLDEPGPDEVVFLRAGKEPIRHPVDAQVPRPCVFEHIYFARPDSVIDGRSVYEVRFELGRHLADSIRAKGLSLDVVIPVPDTSRPAATALSEALSLPLREGLIKNRYSGRTFIMPSDLARKAALRLKLNPLPREIAGRSILLVDDSIVRGNTLRRVIAMLRESGAKAIHLAIHSPPVKHPCYYGIDMSTEEELFARRFEGSLEDIERAAAAELGADSLSYLPVSAMDEAFAGPRCAACFDGDYPEPVPLSDRDLIASERRSSPGR